jgi:NADPH:quinone reductase
MTSASIPCIRIREPGGPEVLELTTVELPAPGPTEVRVRVASSGLNRADLLERRGGYAPPPGAPPRIPGLEYAGVVDAVGEGCTLRRVGDRVMGLVGGGGYAAALLVDERETIRVPEGTETVEAAALPEALMTAWDAAFLQGGLAAGETLLVHAVGSGVGTAALQLARWAGARVVGTSRTSDKLQRAESLGLEPSMAVDTSVDGWPGRIREATGGRGVDVVLDLVGGGYAPGTLETLAPGARWIVVGVPSGREAQLDLRRLMGLRALVRGTVLRTRPAEEKAWLARRFEERVVPGIESGAIRPVLEGVFPAREVVEAHRLLESNRTFGKVLLRWDDP